MTAVAHAFEEVDAVKQVSSIHLTNRINRIKNAHLNDPHQGKGICIECISFSFGWHPTDEKAKVAATILEHAVLQSSG